MRCWPCTAARASTSCRRLEGGRGPHRLGAGVHGGPRRPHRGGGRGRRRGRGAGAVARPPSATSSPITCPSRVPLMTADLRRFAQCGLYQGLASLTDGFLQVEEEFFDEIFEDWGRGRRNKPHHGAGPCGSFPPTACLATQGRMREEGSRPSLQNDEKAADQAAPKKDGRPVVARRALCVGLGGTAALVGLGAVRYAGSATAACARPQARTRTPSCRARMPLREVPDQARPAASSPRRTWRTVC